MTKIPVMLLDIDGVLNAVTTQVPIKVWGPDLWNLAKVQAADGFNYTMRWATPVVQWLNTLDNDGAVEIRWHTTWQYDALKVGKVMGLNEFAVQDCPEYEDYLVNGSAVSARQISQGMPGWWKYPAAERILTDEKRRLIWVDDDIDSEISRASRRTLKAVHQLHLCCPASSAGLHIHDMARVELALKRWEQRDS